MSKMNIILVCSAGMSTSMIVTKMKKFISEKNLDVDVEAVPTTEVESYIETNAIDVLLLGPQVRYLEKRFQDFAEKKGFKVDVINTLHYGTMDGEKILQQALDL